MRKLVLVCLALGSFWSSASGATPGTFPGTQPAHVALAAEVQKVLGVETSDGDVLGALEKVARGDGLEASDLEHCPEDVNQLVKALNQGNPPYLLIGKIVTDLHIDSPGSVLLQEDDWKYGSFLNRSMVITYLWDKSEALLKSDPARAHATCRAAILLAALNDFHAGSLALMKFVRHDSVLANRSGLDAKQRRDLTAVVQAHYAMLKAFTEKSVEAQEIIDTILDGGGEDVPTKLLDSALADWSACETPAAGELGTEFELVQATWKLLNIAGARKDKATIGRIEAFLHDHDEHVESPVVKRWIKEALTQRGDPPSQHLVGHFVMLPGGRIVPATRNSEGKFVPIEE